MHRNCITEKCNIHNGQYSMQNSLCIKDILMQKHTAITWMREQASMAVKHYI